MPRSRIADALRELKLTQRELKCIAGNSFHLPLFGTWCMYILAHVRKHPRNIPLPVMMSEYGTLRSASSHMLEDEVAQDDSIVAGARDDQSGPPSERPADSGGCEESASSSTGGRAEPHLESPSRADFM